MYNVWKVYSTKGSCQEDDYDLFEAYQVDLCIPSEGYFEKDEASTFFHYDEDAQAMTVSFYDDRLKCKGDNSEISLSTQCAVGATTWAYSDESLKLKEQHEILAAIEEEESKLAVLEQEVEESEETLEELRERQAALNDVDTKNSHR